MRIIIQKTQVVWKIEHTSMTHLKNRGTRYPMRKFKELGKLKNNKAPKYVRMEHEPNCLSKE